MKKVIPAWSLVLLALIGCVTIIGIFFALKKFNTQYQVLSNSDVSLRYPQNSNQPETQNLLTTYTDKTLGISFEYPTAWGEIVSYDEEGWYDVIPANPNIEQVDGVIHYMLKLDDFRGDATAPRILSAYRTGELLGRGATFGDSAKLFTSATAVEEWCKSTQPGKLTYAHDTCEIYTNPQGVQIAHAFSDVITVFDVTKVNIHEYGIFHPNHTFYGIILSNEDIQNALGLSDGIVNEQLQALVDSIRFTSAQEE